MPESHLALVTGGAGFIGSHLVGRLLAEGHRVRGLDNFSTGRPQNLAHLRQHPGLELTQVDVTDARAIQPFFQDVAWVFHLAALADIVPSIQRPVEYHHANVNGTLAVLEVAWQAGVKRFVYAASSSCYGIPAQYPTPETAPLQPHYPYALTKCLGEQIALHWAQAYHLPVISLAGCLNGRIVGLENGCIIEAGDFHALMSQGGRFSLMVGLQELEPYHQSVEDKSS